MKKFLTVLLVIAVMFTFSFGSAFADVESDMKDYAYGQIQSFYDALDQYGVTYYNALAVDEDGYLNAAYNSQSVAGFVKMAIVKEYVEKAVAAAKVNFKAAVDAYSFGTSSYDTKAEVLSAMQGSFATAKTEIADTTVFSSTNWKEMLLAQLKADITAANTAIAAINLDNYSTDYAGYTIAFVGSNNVATGCGYTFTQALGSTVTSPITPYDYMEALAKEQSAKVTAATAKTVANVATTDITAVRLAAKIADEAVNGHKKESSTDYYLAPVQTIESLTSDTTLAEAKTLAIAQIKNAITAKKLDMSTTLKNKIAEYEEYKTLGTAEKAALDALKKDAELLDGYFADTEKAITEYVNYQTSVTAVQPIGPTWVSAINSFACNGTTGLIDNTTTILGKTTLGWFKEFEARVDAEAALKADAELLGQLKDVNGKPFYSATELADNLADAIEKVYKTGASYASVKGLLSEGAELALINAKVAYINFIKGTATPGFTPKTTVGKNATLWNEADKTSAGYGSGNATALAKGSSGITGFGVTSNDVYDDAQEEAVKALVKETENSIKAATSVDEIEKIFAAANDKYVAIYTTAKHVTEWATTGKIGAAYVKAEYDNDLFAYATYFCTKNTMTDYDSAVRTPATILDEVAYPIVFEAYSADELAAKVAEAKAAIDNMPTSKEIAAKKTEVEKQIAALPNANAITLADKAAIEAAADAVEDITEIPGQSSYTPLNNATLTAAAKAYEKLAAAELDAAYKALANKATITVEDEAAIEALRDAWDAWAEFVDDYNNDAETSTELNATTDGDGTSSTGKIVVLEAKLATAKYNNALALMAALPANPTNAQKAQVEAARAAFNDLTLEQQAAMLTNNTIYYQNLIDAEEALGLNKDENAKAYVQDLKITARSTKTSKGVKVTIKADVQELLDNGYTVEYKFYRSTKSNAKFGTAKVVKAENTYLNTSGKKGTRYYYKAKLVVKNSEGEVVATTPLTQCLYATRTF